MNIRLRFIANKNQLSESDEKYILKLINSGKAETREIIYGIPKASAKIYQALFDSAKSASEKRAVVNHTPYNKIKDIDDVEFITTLISEDYEAFDRINFDTFRTNERVLDYARILSSYEASLSHTISSIRNNYNEPFTQQDKDTIELCQTIIFNMQDSFDTASLLLSGKLDPKTINFDKTTPAQEDEQPNC